MAGDVVNLSAKLAQSLFTDIEPGMSEWYYSHNGQQKGPVPVSELSRLASNGDFDPEKDLVWREGMPDWQPAVTVDTLPFGKPAPAPADVPEEVRAPVSSTPYQAPASNPAPATTGAYTGPAATCGLAIASLVCGIIGFFTCFVWCLSIPVAIAAIVTGHMALSKIKADPSRLTGRGLALAGLATGYVGAVLSVIYIAGVMWFATRSPEQIQQMDWMPEEFRENFSREMERQKEMREQSEEASEAP